MSELIQQCRTAMRWMILVGCMSLWLLLNPQLDVVHLARQIVDPAVLPIASATKNIPSVADLSDTPHIQRPLAEYRHLFQHAATSDFDIRDDKEAEIAKFPLAAVLFAGNEAFIKSNPRHASPLSEIYLSDYRAAFGKFETLFEHSGLSEYATVADLHEKSAQSLMVPGIELELNCAVIQWGSAGALVVLQLYLIGLMKTVRELLQPSADDLRQLRCWLPFQLSKASRFLAVLSISAPCALWIVQAVMAPLNCSQPPSLSLLATAFALFAGALLVFRETANLRQRLRELSTNCADASTPPAPKPLSLSSTAVRQAA